MRRGLAESAAVAALVAPLFAVKLWSADLWWHLATGRLIAQTGSVPRVDSFSHTMSGQPWHYVNWIGDLVLYGAYAAGGYFGVVLLKVLLAWLALTLFGGALRLLEVPRVSALAVVVFGGLLLQPRFSMGRTFSIGVVLLCLGLYASARWRIGERRWAWLLVPLYGVWLGVHGNAVLGIGLAGAVLAAALLEKAWRVPAALVVVGTVALTFVTQSGRDILAIVRRGDKSIAYHYTAEMQAFSLGEARVWVPLFVLAVSLGYCAWTWRKNLLPLCWAIGGALILTQLARNIYAACVLALPGFALALGALSERVKLAPVALAGLIALNLGVSSYSLETRWGLGVDESFSEDVVEALRGHPTGKVMNNPEIGGWLMWHEVPVFVDGRTNVLYEDESFRRLIIDPVKDAKALEASAEAHDITYGVASLEAPLGKVMMSSRAWVPLFHGDTATLFVRRARMGDLKGLDELRALESPRWMVGWYRGVLGNAAGRERLRRAIVHTAKQNPDAPTLLAALAVLGRLDPGFVQGLRGQVLGP